MDGGLIFNFCLAFITLVIAVGGVYALVKQKIVVDEQGHVTEVEIPVLGKIKSNYPSVIVIFIAAALIVYLQKNFRAPEDLLPLQANIKVQLPADVPESAIIKFPDVLFSATPLSNLTYESMRNLNDEIPVRLRVERDKDYQVVVYVAGTITQDGKIYRPAFSQSRISAEDISKATKPNFILKVGGQ